MKIRFGFWWLLVVMALSGCVTVERFHEGMYQSYYGKYPWLRPRVYQICVREAVAVGLPVNLVLAVIDAEQFTEENKDRVFNFVRCNKAADFEDGEPVLRIQTLEGVMTARIDDWVIRGVNGEFYPCKPDIFAATYEPVEETGTPG